MTTVSTPPLPLTVAGETMILPHYYQEVMTSTTTRTTPQDISATIHPEMQEFVATAPTTTVGLPKKVQFSPKVRVRRIDPLRTDAERITRWYGRDEMKRIEQDVRTEVALARTLVARHANQAQDKTCNPSMESGSKTSFHKRRFLGVVGPNRKRTAPLVFPPTDNTVERLEDVTWSPRGLEHMICDEQCAYRQHVKTLVIRSVLMEQERQQRVNHGEYDCDFETQVAQACAFSSRESKMRGVALGRQDAKFVQSLTNLQDANTAAAAPANDGWNKDDQHYCEQTSTSASRNASKTRGGSSSGTTTTVRKMFGCFGGGVARGDLPHDEEVAWLPLLTGEGAPN